MANTHSLDLELSSSQHAWCADNADVSVTGDISMGAWINLEQLPSTPSSAFTIASKSDANGSQYSYQLIITTADKLRFQWWSSTTAGNNVLVQSDNALVDTATWIHVAAAIDVSTQDGTLYKDGSPWASSPTVNGAGATSIHDSTARFAIGARFNTNAELFFDGKVDDVRLWDDIRSDAEIDDNKCVELAGTEDNLVGYWKLNNNYTDTAKSSDLTAAGSPVFSEDVANCWAITEVVQDIIGEGIIPFAR